jgi:ammonium transporter Rh
MLNGLFCSGACLISLGAVIGKINSLQLMVLIIVEPFFYWLNYFIGALQLDAFDIGGGMFIHTFGCYFGLAACWWVTSKDTHGHPDNCSCYSSDIFSYAGTLFLWMMWPSFNGVLGASPEEQNRAFFNTFMSLCACTVSTFLTSRLVSVCSIPQSNLLIFSQKGGWHRTTILSVSTFKTLRWLVALSWVWLLGWT